MIQRKYETVVGIFVVASMAALLLMVLVIAQQERLWEEHIVYQAVFKNISGLKVGSEVQLAGLTVGNIKEITIDPQGLIIVTFEVVGKYRSRVREDSRATIAYQGLLGEKSLNISAGSPDKKEIPDKGRIDSTEPLDITEIIAKAQPSLENLQKLLTNLAALSENLTKPEGDFAKSMEELGQIVSKINTGYGSLGLFLNDKALYRDYAQAVANIRKLTGAVQESKGVLGTLLNDPVVKADFQKTMGNLQEATSRFPEMAKKAEVFLEQLQRASKGLPGLVTSGESMVGNVDKAAKAAQKSWLLRRNVPQPKERTLRIEREQKRD